MVAKEEARPAKKAGKGRAFGKLAWRMS